MARTVVIGNETFKQRNILGVWLGLPIITFGIYHLIWWFNINDEARRYLRDDRVNPWLSLLALLIGWILIIPPFVSIYRTCDRVRRMEAQAGLPSQIEPVLGLVLSFVFGIHAMYIQSHLNSLWERYLLAAPATSYRIPPPPPVGALAPPPLPYENEP